MIQRNTQTAAYWQSQFMVSREDLDYLYGWMLDEGKPVPTATLALLLVERHCRKEEESIQVELSKGAAYRPAEQHAVGDQLIFPALDYVAGIIVGMRKGRNPEYGDLDVIQVQLEGEKGVREFASNLQADHKLNHTGSEDLNASLISPAELYELYGPVVDKRLVSALSSQDGFVSFKGQWFLQDMLAPVHPGHLNIVEALIDVKGAPLTTEALLADLGLPAEISTDVQVLSLNHALERDERFNNVGDGGRDIWYLNRLTPEPVIHPPRRLIIRGEPYDRGDINQELLLIEREIDDEGSGEEVMGPSRPIYKTTIALAYPHWRMGTLPLTVRTRGLFPQSTTHHSPVVLVDLQSGDKMQGWVVHQERFVYGLKDWFKRYDLPVGAFIKLERTRDPRVIQIDFEARRMKRLWMKMAVAEGDNLVFQMIKVPVTCEYDEQLAIGEENPTAIDRLWQRAEAQGDTLYDLMIQLMPELIKLSPQATVHAKAIYSAVNVLRRTAPGPIFALLSTEPGFVSMGGGYWTFDATQI